MCPDPTLIGEYYAYSDKDYVETPYPINPEDSRLAEVTQSNAMNAFLLFRDIAAIGLGADWVARSSKTTLQELFPTNYTKMI
jgi:hypothetical protein